MGPLVILCLAGLLACWIMLSILASERQRQLQDFEAMQQAARSRSAALAAEAAMRKTQPATNPRQSAR